MLGLETKGCWNMLHKCHAAGVLFWCVDENNDTWVLVGRRKNFPARERWSIPIIRCQSACEDGNEKFDYEKTALLACEKELGIVLQKEKKLSLLKVKRNPFQTFYIFSCQLESPELPPLKNDFHMVMWSKSNEVPKPNTIFFSSLLHTFNRQRQVV